MVSLSSVCTCIVVMMLMVPPGIQNSGNIYALLAVFCSVCSIRSCLEQCCMIWESLIALGVEIARKVIVYTVFLQQCSTIIHKCIVKALHDLLMRYHYGKQAVLSSHLLKD